ncbi:MAG: NAD(P)-dependent alcohol dehydrogenase [Chitinivibrionales bacterium]|nr:NAD(P)-dependent alcohol dehydrogenase [Chitinivibrionales bacterium]
MKAIICTKYGPPDVLQIGEVTKPIPKDNEVLVKIHAAGVTISDCYIRSGKGVKFRLWLPMRIYVGFRKPRNPILGFDLAGEVESTGNAVKQFKKGDQILGFSGKHFGAYAEYICLPENKTQKIATCLIALKPFNITYEEAAAVPSRGYLALQFMKLGNIQKDQKVLIYGASGGIGTFALQIAKYFEAEVTGVCSTSNLEMIKTLGADKVIDYTTKEILKRNDKYNFIFDATPYDRRNRKMIRLQCLKMLAPNGKFISVDDIVHPKSNSRTEDFNFIKGLIAAGRIKPVIDKIYRMEQIAEAHKYIEQKHKKGNAVIKICN